MVGLDGKELLHGQLKQTRVVMPPSPASRPGILNIARVLPLLEARPSIAVKVALVQALGVQGLGCRVQGAGCRVVKLSKLTARLML